MKRTLSLIVTTLCVVLIAVPTIGSMLAGSATSAAGPLLIVGGGGTPQVVLKRALAWAGDDADVVVLPFASGREKRGERSVQMWLDAGAARAAHVDNATSDAARLALETANIVWMPGGSQTALMEELRRRGLVDAVVQAHARGALVGGTSAGAAVMSQIMIARSADGPALVSKRTPLGTGLGLLPGAIVDQHFVRRERNNRLLQTVLDHPVLVGFGIDERTALWVEPSGSIEVLGESQVLVYDARQAARSVRGSDHRLGARGVTLHVLLPGDRF